MCLLASAKSVRGLGGAWDGCEGCEGAACAGSVSLGGLGSRVAIITVFVLLGALSLLPAGLPRRLGGAFSSIIASRSEFSELSAICSELSSIYYNTQKITEA